MSSGASTDDQGLRPWQFFLLAGMLSATAIVLVAGGQSVAALIVLSFTVVAASLAALGAFRALAPLVDRRHAEPPPLIVGRTRASLEREKTLALRAIKDLEFDYATKKIAKSDYEEMSARLRARALRLMKQLDEGGGYRTAIEQELERKLAEMNVLPSAATPQPSGEAAAERRHAGEPAHGLRCTCGTINDGDAQFCKRCGARLVAA